MSKDWQRAVIDSEASIGQAVKTINACGYDIAVMASVEGNLIGTITDGDVRRAILNGCDLDGPASDIVNAEPLTSPAGTPGETLLRLMNKNKIRQMPLIDSDGCIDGLVHIRELTQPITAREHWVLLMAGGRGERLRPLTADQPKPLIKVGEKPILETTLERLIEQKFRHFYISVNYLSQAIKEHFGDGSEWGVEIRYLEENQRLGTAGALRLIKEPPEAPLIVMNGDLLTNINFQDLLDYHELEGCAGTMCVRQYDFQVPFGVIKIDGNTLRSIDEKPVRRMFVNAGIYVLDPALIASVPADVFYDMTTLFQNMTAAGNATKVFPVHEYWLDVGRIEDLEKARYEFNSVFGK